MRFMVLVKASEDSEAGIMPTEEQLADMGKFNEEMVKAGVMLAGEGLHPSSKGARVKFSGSERTVTDGPFTETKELIAGFWLIQVKSREEAIEWIKRCPNPGPGESETGSPIVELNRAVALAQAFGPETGLELVDELASEPSLEDYHLLPSVRGDLPRQARSSRRGTCGARARGGAHPQLAGA